MKIKRKISLETYKSKNEKSGFSPSSWRWVEVKLLVKDESWEK